MNDATSPKTPRKRGGNGTATPTKPDRFAEGYDFLLINHDIDDALFPDVLSTVTENQKHDKAVVIVVTYGGLANVAYRIGRFLQTMYGELVVFVPSICKSAGTLIAAGAHCVICIGFGEVGPLDVQVTRRDEIWGRRSGLTTRSALIDLRDHTFDLFEHTMYSIISHSRGSVSFKLAAEISAKMTAEVMSSIYAQINPEALGQDFMDLNVAKEYCDRLNKHSKNLKDGAIHRLVYDYPTHDFVIDFEEAKEIFENVELPTATLLGLLRSRMTDMLTPRLRSQGVVQMLTIPAKPAENPKVAGEAKAEAKSGDGGTTTTRGNGGGKETPA